jgi:peptidoglycan/xylan/chitin deacetylase (PgdA/CDA1 family)
MIGRDLKGYGKEYPVISWPGDALLAVSLVVEFEEGAERSPLYGDDGPETSPQPVRPQGSGRAWTIESTFEYGPRRGFWRLMDIFDKHDVKVTFFCSGAALEANPAAARSITQRGHEAAGHGYRWLPSYELSRGEEEEDIAKAIRAVHDTTGERPVGWHSRAPSVNTRELLVENGGFLYDSDSYSDDLPHFAQVNDQRFLTVPHSHDTNDEKFLPAPLVPGFTRPDQFFSTLKGTFDRLYDEGSKNPKMMTVGLHLRLSGRPPRAAQVDRFIRYARGFPRVWFARRVDIARWWLERYRDL